MKTKAAEVRKIRLTKEVVRFSVKKVDLEKRSARCPTADNCVPPSSWCW